MSWQRDSGELDQPLELTDSDTQQEMEEEDGGEEEEEEEEVVCFGLGEDDSDEVTEDEADVGVAIGPPVGVVATPLGTGGYFTLIMSVGSCHCPPPPPPPLTPTPPWVCRPHPLSVSASSPCLSVCLA